MFRQAGKAETVLCTAVDHFTGETDIILCQEGAATDASCRIIHGQVPDGRGKAAYRVPEH